MASLYAILVASDHRIAGEIEKEDIMVTAKAEDAGDAHVTDALKVYGQIGEQ